VVFCLAAALLLGSAGPAAQDLCALRSGPAPLLGLADGEQWPSLLTQTVPFALALRFPPVLAGTLPSTATLMFLSHISMFSLSPVFRSRGSD